MAICHSLLLLLKSFSKSLTSADRLIASLFGSLPFGFGTFTHLTLLLLQLLGKSELLLGLTCSTASSGLSIPLGLLFGFSLGTHNLLLLLKLLSKRHILWIFFGRGWTLSRLSSWLVGSFLLHFLLCSLQLFLH